VIKSEFIEMLVKKGYKSSRLAWNKPFKLAWKKSSTIVEVNHTTYTKFHEFKNGSIVQIESLYFSQHKNL
jgi:hypothetical protein